MNKKSLLSKHDFLLAGRVHTARWRRLAMAAAAVVFMAALVTPAALAEEPGPSKPTGKPKPGIWISKEEVMKLPMSGPAWAALKAQADLPAGTPDVSNQDLMNNVYVLAKALVYARTGIEKYRTEVRENCMAAIDTEKKGRTLALGRKLCAYVLSADLVKLEPAEDRKFRAWLKDCVNETIVGWDGANSAPGSNRCAKPMSSGPTTGARTPVPAGWRWPSTSGTRRRSPVARRC